MLVKKPSKRLAFGHTGIFISAEAERDALAKVAAVREAVGPDVELLVECHGRLSTTAAIRIGNALEEYRPYVYARRLFDSNDSADLHLKAGWHRDSPRPRAPVCFEVTFPVECLLAAGEILGPTQFSISEAEPRPPVTDQMAKWFRSQPNLKERNADEVFRSFTKQFPEASFDEFQAAYEGGADETRKSAKKNR